MKNKPLCPLLYGALAVCLALVAGCKVPKLQVSYNDLIRQQYARMLEEETAAQNPVVRALADSTGCLHIYEAYFPYCSQVKQEEFILEKTLAFDFKCQDTIAGYQRFSLIEITQHKVLEKHERVLFISFAQTQNHIAERIERLGLLTGDARDTLQVRGAVTLYSGRYENDTTILFDKRYIYTTPPKINLFSREGRLKKSTALTLRMVLAKDKTRGKENVVLKRIINYGRNELSDSKPLVFELPALLQTRELKLPYFFAECRAKRPLQ
ncbi:MAG: hypothetical protein IT260_12545 [Saprospiraceae bacterium]|nr:hypothetical protein [Saprospiraceae bacterium]